MEDNKGTPAPVNYIPVLVKHTGERWHTKDAYNSAEYYLTGPGHRYNYAKVDTSQNNSIEPNEE